MVNMQENKEFPSLNTESKRNMPEKLKTERKVYLSKESVALDAYILAGICFNINDRCNGHVKFKITTRGKSEDSTMRKKKRFEKEKEEGKRQDITLHDIIASKLVIRRVDEDDELLYAFSSKVGGLYQQRKEDLDLLGSIINFFNEQKEIGEFHSEYDREETLQEKLDSLDKAFNDDFGDNIQRYRPGINIENIKRPDLENEIITILRELRQEENDSSLDEKYLRAMKFLIAERTAIERNKRINLNEEITKTDDQEEYYKYIIVLLKRMLDLEYPECKSSCREIKAELTNKILEFSHLIRGKAFNNNVTLEYLEDLEKWSKRLNAQMSDKLQNQIIEEIMESSTYLEFPDQSLSVAMEEKEDHSINIDRKRKDNGYASNHYNLIKRIGENIKLILEIQAMTFYRSKVSSYGNAAYGTGREDPNIGEEKKRPLKLIPKYDENRDYKDKDNTLKRRIIIEEFGNIENMTKEQFENWKERITAVTPKYFTTFYDEEEDKVKFVFHSMLENAKIYFSETNNRRQRKMIEEGFKIIENMGLLEGEEQCLEISREEYEKAMKNGKLSKLVKAVENLYEVSGIEQEEEER